jgi:hypothetical protein
MASAYPNNTNNSNERGADAGAGAGAKQLVYAPEALGITLGVRRTGGYDLLRVGNFSEKVVRQQFYSVYSILFSLPL